MTNIENAHLNIAAASHPGMSGKKNEDRYMVSSFMIGPCGVNLDKTDLPAVLAVVCDGIGGHRAGEVAAQMGVTMITEAVSEASSGRSSDDDSGKRDDCEPIKLLEEAIRHANHAIHQASLSDQGRKGMGATCACAWVIDDRLYTANLGDSRIYLLRQGHILQLTTDHTWLQEAYDAGIIDEINIESHPNAHVIRRYLGSAKPLDVDFRLWFYEGEGDAEALDNQGLRLEPGDVVLICSDGLTDLVSDEEIYQLVTSNSVEQAPADLIDLANARGGHDNITVVLMAVPSGKRTIGAAKRTVSAKRKTYRGVRGLKDKSPRWRWLIGCLAVLIITILLVAGVYFGMQWWARRPEPVTYTATPTQVLPLPTQTQAEVLVTTTPTVTLTPTPMENLATPQIPTITPWPTHTTAP